jgi:hypothetical protein
MGSQRSGFTTAMLTGVAFATVLTGASCGGDSGGGEGTSTSPTTPVAGGGAAGKTAATAGAAGKATAGSTAAPPTTTARPPTAGSATTPPPGATNPGAPAAGGSGGTPASSAGGAGATATAGGAAQAGAGGGTNAGAAGGGAVTPVDMGGAFAIRGEDPTDESANGREMGPYAVESYTSGYMRGDFSDATMWYPTSEEAKPPFGCVAVVPGFVSPQSSIRNWGPFLASNGIVAITIGVPGSDQPAQRAVSLLSALETCLGENTREDSPIKGKLSENHLGVSGWSMGGGGTLIAASQNPKM